MSKIAYLTVKGKPFMVNRTIKIKITRQAEEDYLGGAAEEYWKEVKAIYDREDKHEWTFREEDKNSYSHDDENFMHNAKIGKRGLISYA